MTRDPYGGLIDDRPTAQGGVVHDPVRPSENRDLVAISDDDRGGKGGKTFDNPRLMTPKQRQPCLSRSAGRQCDDDSPALGVDTQRDATGAGTPPPQNRGLQFADHHGLGPVM
jgi:hypothetical protein